MSRASWPVRKFELGHEPPHDLGATTTAEERIAMVDCLTSQVWPLTGHAPADYSREETPVTRRP
jgi:hypothetical protein